MFDTNKYDFCSEFYTIEKSIEVVIARQKYRLDVIKNEDTNKFSVNAYIRELFELTSGYSHREPNSYFLWRSYNLSTIETDSADTSLNLALTFLRPTVTK
jgi:hypothetical protein